MLRCRSSSVSSSSATDAEDHEAVLVARLKSSLLRYPADAALVAMVDYMRTRSRRFDALWRAPRPVEAYESSATFTQSDGDSVTLVGSLVAIPGDDLAAVMLTAAPGSRDAARLVEVVGAAEEQPVIRVGQSGPG